MILALSTLAILACTIILVTWFLPAPSVRAQQILPPPPPLPLESLFPRDTMNDYQTRAAYYDTQHADALAIHCMGLAEETGETVSHVRKHYLYGKDVNVEQLSLELGDVLWHVAAIARRFEISLDDVAQGNLNKLATRWPKGGPR